MGMIINIKLFTMHTILIVECQYSCAGRYIIIIVFNYCLSGRIAAVSVGVFRHSNQMDYGFRHCTGSWAHVIAGKILHNLKSYAIIYDCIKTLGGDSFEQC